MDPAVRHPAVLSARYRLGEELGRGAAGVVVLGRDLRHDREVAVKLLDPNAAAALGPERFLSEIRIAARLQHPNILAIHDSGEAEGQLYYVMPRVRGESLARRLERERRLPVPEAVGIARAVAAALAHAHVRGVVHRDVKPENILLDADGHVYLTDFGLATALSTVASSSLTGAGVSVGSPPYMSPEQAAGDVAVDARSDVYGLGCVLFEMLAGAPPFPGESAQAVLRRHLTEPPPSLSKRRADVPAALDAVVARALAKAPADRFATASALARALQEAEGRRSARAPAALAGWRARRVFWVAAAATAAAAVLALVVWRTPVELPRPFAGAALDSTRYAVLPFRREGAVPGALRADLSLHDGVARWRELEVVDRLQVSDAVARRGDGSLTAREARDVARELGAGRYVHGVLTALGDSVHVEAVLYDARQGRALRVARLQVAAATAGPEPTIAALADSLLFGGLVANAADAAGYDAGTRSYAARLAFGRGHEALQAWDLTAADSLFAAAVAEDAAYGRAQLWLAQVRNWAGAAVEGWAAPAERAVALEDELGPREAGLARGLALMARGEFPAACEAYEALRLRDDRDFAAWYGLGECRQRDNLVVADPSSPSGWSFRSSYHQGVEAYRRAFEVLPSSHRGFGAGGFGRVREVLYTSAALLRQGMDGDGQLFGATAEWSGDTLAFVPFRWRPGAATLRPAEARQKAVAEQRRVFRDVAAAWHAAFPDSPEAAEAVAVSLEMVGSLAALDTLLRARALATDEAHRARLAVHEVLLRVKFGAGRDLDQVRAARRLADSLLADADAAAPSAASQLSQLAALTGRPVLAAALARKAAGPVAWPAEMPATVTAPAAAASAYAAAATLPDSTAALERAAEAAIRHLVDPGDRAVARRYLLEHAAMLSFPEHVFGLARQGNEDANPIVRAQSALLSGDSAVARRLLLEQLSLLGAYRPADRAVDAVVAQALLLARLDPERAAAWLDATLGELEWLEPGVLGAQYRGAALVRGMELRARLARQAGDEPSWRRWTATLRVLRGRGSGGGAAEVRR